MVGTMPYISPEMCNFGSGYGPEVDWWSVGIVLYELIYGETPFTGRDLQIQMSLLNPDIAVQFNPLIEISDEAKDLLTKLLTKCKTDRLHNAQDLKSHLFFKDIDWQTLHACGTPPFIPSIKSQDDITFFAASTNNPDEEEETDDENDDDYLDKHLPYIGYTYSCSSLLNKSPTIDSQNILLASPMEHGCTQLQDEINKLKKLLLEKENMLNNQKMKRHGEFILHKKELESSQLHAKEVEASNISLVIQMHELESRNKLLESSNQVSKLSIDTKCAELEIRTKELELQNKTLGSRTKELESRNESLELHKTELISRNKLLEINNKELESKNRLFEQRNQSSEIHTKELESKNNTLEQNTYQLESKNKLLEQTTKELESRNKLLEQTTRELESKNELLFLDNQALESDIKDLMSIEQECTELKQEIKLLKRENHALLSKIPLLEDQSRQLSTETSNQLDELKNEVSHLKEKLLAQSNHSKSLLEQQSNDYTVLINQLQSECVELKAELTQHNSIALRMKRTNKSLPNIPIAGGGVRHDSPGQGRSLLTSLWQKDRESLKDVQQALEASENKLAFAKRQVLRLKKEVKCFQKYTFERQVVENSGFACNQIDHHNMPRAPTTPPLDAIRFPTPPWFDQEKKAVG